MIVAPLPGAGPAEHEAQSGRNDRSQHTGSQPRDERPLRAVDDPRQRAVVPRPRKPPTDKAGHHGNRRQPERATRLERRIVASDRKPPPPPQPRRSQADAGPLRPGDRGRPTTSGQAPAAAADLSSACHPSNLCAAHSPLAVGPSGLFRADRRPPEEQGPRIRWRFRTWRSYPARPCSAAATSGSSPAEGCARASSR